MENELKQNLHQQLLLWLVAKGLPRLWESSKCVCISSGVQFPKIEHEEGIESSTRAQRDERTIPQPLAEKCRTAQHLEIYNHKRWVFMYPMVVIEQHELVRAIYDMITWWYKGRQLLEKKTHYCMMRVIPITVTMWKQAQLLVSQNDHLSGTVWLQPPNNSVLQEFANMVIQCCQCQTCYCPVAVSYVYRQSCTVHILQTAYMYVLSATLH